MQREMTVGFAGTRRRGWLFALSALMLSGCSTLAYYGQAVNGELQVLANRRPIAAVVADPTVAASTREQLEQVARARVFAVQVLALPDNGSYQDYVDLGRPYPVWNVVAAPALSVKPVEQCFPVAGCVSYRGYFSHAAARAHAESMRRKGLDVSLRPVIAYSTLGWFDDPVFNSMLNRGEASLVGTLFHELAHQLIYVKNDAAFNESFAMTVEQAGLRRWFRQRDKPKAWIRWQHEQAHNRAFNRLLLRTRQHLAAVYAGSASKKEKYAQKIQTFRQLKREYHDLRLGWGEDHRYDHYMSHALNNADLALAATYHRWIPAFQALLGEARGRLPAFYHAVRSLAAETPPQREAALRRLAKRYRFTHQHDEE